MKFLLSLLPAIALFSPSLAEERACSFVTTRIGAHKDVEMDQYICEGAKIEARQATNGTNVCGATCELHLD